MRRTDRARTTLPVQLRLETLESRDLPAVITAFTPRFQATDHGDIALVANTLLTAPASNPNATNAQNGVGSVLNNNSFSMVYVDVDGDAGTVNSSQATLSLPPGATVQWAGLYWGALSTAGTRNQVLFAVPGSAGYEAITGSVLGSSGANYQAFADVTARVRAAGNGTYMLGNVAADTGSGAYAGWSLVVVYRDAAAPVRNLTVFDGLAQVVGSAPVELTLSGFVAPPTGTVTARVGVVSYEGDLGTNGDALFLNNTELVDAANPSGNFFNSTISSPGTRNPSYVNQLGFDADLVDTAGLIANNSTSATLKLFTAGDVYLPGVITTAIDTVNAAPTSGDDNFNVPANAGPTFLDVLANDSDADLDPLQVTAVTSASHGAVAIAVAGAGVVYTPNAGYSGADSFTYSASDGRGGLTTGVVNLNVQAANQPPVINPDFFRIPFGSGAVYLDPLRNDYDPDGTPLTILSASSTGGGSIAVVEGRGLLYTPGTYFTGTDVVTYTISDGGGAIITAAFTVEVFERSGGAFDGLAGNAFAVVGNPIALLPLSDPGNSGAPSLPGGQVTFLELGGEVGVPVAAKPGGADEDDPTSGEISGVVFLDNGQRNGKRDAGEVALQNQPVTLYARQGNEYIRIGQTTTDLRGSYRFRGLKPGTYRVKYTLPNGVEATAPHDEEGYTEEVVEGSRAYKRDFGIRVREGVEEDPLRGIPAAVELSEDKSNPRPTPEKAPTREPEVPSKQKPTVPSSVPPMPMSLLIEYPPDEAQRFGPRLDLSNFLCRSVTSLPGSILPVEIEA